MKLAEHCANCLPFSLSGDVGRRVIGALTQTGGIDEDDRAKALLLAGAQLPAEEERILGLVAVVAQGSGQRDPLARIDLGGAGVAGQALRLHRVHLAQAEDQSCGEPQRAHALRSTGQIVLLQCTLIGVHVTVVGLNQAEGNVLTRMRQQHIQATATREAIAPLQRLELRSGYICGAGGEMHERNEVLAEEEAIHRAGFRGVERVGDAAELHEGRRGR